MKNLHPQQLFSRCSKLCYHLTILMAIVAVSFVTAREGGANCPHGLTANDIAAKSGLDLSGKIALVTGGRSGLGYAISEALLQQNCTVIIASRDETLNREAVAQLQTDVPGADISYQTFDLEDFDNVRAFASTMAEAVPRLDYYFANAGRGSGSQPLTVNGYDRIFQTNYVGQFLLLDLLLPLLRESESARVLLTGSSSHSLACGNLFLSSYLPTGEGAEEDTCFSDESSSTALAMLPFDQQGLDVVNNTFGCAPLASTYPLTKYLMVQLAPEMMRREAAAGYNNVHVYSWAPGNIRTDLNPWASCCVGPAESFGPGCRYQLPYVGPKDAEGNPNRPEPAVPNFWSSPAHGAMAALYVALHADKTEAGSFFATYWECEENKGYFSQGMTPEGRAQLFDLSMEWADISHAQQSNTTNIADPDEAEAGTEAPGTVEESTIEVSESEGPLNIVESLAGSGASHRVRHWTPILLVGLWFGLS